MLPSFDSGEDAAWACGPHERVGIGICLGDEALDSCLEFCDGSEHAAFEPSVGKLGEEAFDGVEPRRRGGREVEGPARVLGEPLLDLWVLVGGVVVDDRVDFASGPVRRSC